MPNINLLEGKDFSREVEKIDEEKRDRRYEITVNNAKAFIEGYQKSGYLPHSI